QAPGASYRPRPVRSLSPSLLPAVKRASGVRLGRPPTIPEAVLRQIQRRRARGDTLRKIAGDLNQAGEPTAFEFRSGACLRARTWKSVSRERLRQGPLTVPCPATSDSGVGPACVRPDVR